MIKAFISCLFVMLCAFPLAAEMPLDNAAEEAKAQHLFRLLRCEVCVGQSIYDSNAPLALDMRAEVRDLIRAGKTEDEILRLYATRFGDKVLMRPPVKESTWALWFFPFFAILTGGLIVSRLFRTKENA